VSVADCEAVIGVGAHRAHPARLHVHWWLVHAGWSEHRRGETVLGGLVTLPFGTCSLVDVAVQNAPLRLPMCLRPGIRSGPFAQFAQHTALASL